MSGVPSWLCRVLAHETIARQTASGPSKLRLLPMVPYTILLVWWFR